MLGQEPSFVVELIVYGFAAYVGISIFGAIFGERNPHGALTSIYYPTTWQRRRAIQEHNDRVRDWDASRDGYFFTGANILTLGLWGLLVAAWAHLSEGGNNDAAAGARKYLEKRKAEGYGGIEELMRGKK